MRGADAHPGALVNCALLAVVAVRQICLASEGGWARLKTTEEVESSTRLAVSTTGSRGLRTLVLFLH